MTPIDKMAMDLAKKHAEIIEEECKKACKNFVVEPKDLILEYHGHAEIKIKIQASHFEIKNSFQIKDEEVTQQIYGVNEVAK